MGVHDGALWQRELAQAWHGSLGCQWAGARHGKCGCISTSRVSSTCKQNERPFSKSVLSRLHHKFVTRTPQVIPSGQSLIADYYPDSSRGKAFGGLFLTGAVGGMLGSLYATNLGESLCI